MAQKLNRRAFREHICRLLFCLDFYSEEEAKEQVSMYLKEGCLEEKDLPTVEEAEDAAEITAKVEEIRARISEIDEVINDTAKGWKTSRMNLVDLSILRLAVYEVLYDDAIPSGVAVNEAVELAKKYSSEEAASFINGILGTVTRRDGEEADE